MDPARIRAARLLIVATRGAGAASSERQQAQGERERAEEVAAELQLETVGGGESAAAAP